MRYLFLIQAFLLSAVATGQMNNLQLKRSIDSLNAEMEKAFNANDMTKVASFYADDAEIVADNYLVKGRANLDRYWLSLKDKGRGWKLTVTEIGGSGEFAYQLGTSDLSYTRGNSATPSKAVTNFVLIWKLQPDGQYRIFRDYLTKVEFKK